MNQAPHCVLKGTRTVSPQNPRTKPASLKEPRTKPASLKKPRTKIEMYSTVWQTKVISLLSIVLVLCSIQVHCPLSLLHNCKIAQRYYFFFIYASLPPFFATSVFFFLPTHTHPFSRSCSSFLLLMPFLLPAIPPPPDILPACYVSIVMPSLALLIHNS